MSMVTFFRHEILSEGYGRFLVREHYGPGHHYDENISRREAQRLKLIPPDPIDISEELDRECAEARERLNRSIGQKARRAMEAIRRVLEAP